MTLHLEEKHLIMALWALVGFSLGAFACWMTVRCERCERLIREKDGQTDPIK